MSVKGIKFASLVIILQVGFVIIMALLGEYPDVSNYRTVINNSTIYHESSVSYPNFQDVNVMIFVGFGFLMTFLKNYGFSAVGLNLMLSSIMIQWAFIVRGFIHVDIIGGDKFHMGVMDMVTSDFATATVLISFGAVLGKASPVQLVVMGLLEVLLAQLNEYVGVDLLHVTDIGESMFIHMFGAYFGLAVARVLYNQEVEHSNKEGSVYHSDLFAMIGTLFLWIYWPSFNGGFAADQEQRDRAYLNTFLSLCACTAFTFAISALVDKEGHYDMVHIQNSTLAGGVAVGATANMPMQPYGAMIFGAVAGTLSVLGYKFLSPMMSKRLKIHDTCGVHNLHGMPGVLAAVGSAVLAAVSDGWSDHDRLAIFPKTESDRSPGDQGGFQFLAAVITLGIAIGGGTLTGFILKIPIWDAPREENLFEDGDNWELPEEGVPVSNSTNHYKVTSGHPESRMEVKDKLLTKEGQP